MRSWDAPLSDFRLSSLFKDFTVDPLSHLGANAELPVPPNQLLVPVVPLRTDL